MVRQALRVGMVTVAVAAVWPTALAWAPTATPAPGDRPRRRGPRRAHGDGASAGASRPRRRSGWCRTRGRCRRCSSRTSPAASSWSRPSRSTRRVRCWPRRRWPRRRSPTTPATTPRSSTCGAAKRCGRARRSTPSSRRSRPASSASGRWSARRWPPSRPATSRPRPPSTRRCRRTSPRSPTRCCSDSPARWRRAANRERALQAYRDLYYGYPTERRRRPTPGRR